MLRGSAWAVAMRWGIRLIGLASVVILARLLSPEDFGVAAMGALTIGFISTFSELGVQMLLIREQNAGRDDCDTAWTLKILQGIFIAVLLVSIAPLAARYFGDPRVVEVLYVLSVGAVFEGARNIGMVLARKELDFAKDFRFNVYVRLISFGVTVSLAFGLRSYWALVVGQVLSALISIPLSFRMHAYRPRFSLVGARKYLRFSASIVPFQFGRYLAKKVDALVVGGYSGTQQLGVYNVASDLSAMLTQEILAPLGRGLMPNYAKLNHDPEQLAVAFGHVLRTSVAVVLPLGLGLSVVAADFVGLVLGDQWGAVVPLLRLLAVYSMLVALIHIMSSQILIVAGYERTSAVLTWVRLAIMIPIVIAGARGWGVEGAAAGALASAAIAFPLAVIVLVKSIPLSPRTVVSAYWRPCAAALIMAVIANRLAAGIDYSPFVRLLISASVGATAYVAALFGLWVISGRPRGIEQVVVDYVSAKRAGAASAGESD
ncbi:MAG: lipopolysaccharide biosynthesis protein [Gammaproteobacteria bacterium]